MGFVLGGFESEVVELGFVLADLEWKAVEVALVDSGEKVLVMAAFRLQDC
jgi:hypothetical protein